MDVDVVGPAAVAVVVAVAAAVAEGDLASPWLCSVLCFFLSLGAMINSELRPRMPQGAPSMNST